MNKRIQNGAAIDLFDTGSFLLLLNCIPGSLFVWLVLSLEIGMAPTNVKEKSDWEGRSALPICEEIFCINFYLVFRVTSNPSFQSFLSGTGRMHPIC